MSSEAFVAQLASAVNALEVRSGAGYAWLGTAVDPPAALRAVSDPAIIRQAQVQGIARRLYGDFFSAGRPRSIQGTDHGSLGRRMSEALTAANAGRGCLDPAWRVEGEDREQFVVAKGGLRLWVGLDEVVLRGSGAIRAGDEVSVRLASDAPCFSPGYYMALGDRGLDPGPRVLDRFYVHLRPEGAPRSSCGRQRSCSMRSTSLPSEGRRRPRTATTAATRRSSRSRARTAPGRCPRCAPYASRSRTPSHRSPPALTRPIAPGLSFAEDPGGG